MRLWPSRRRSRRTGPRSRPRPRTRQGFAELILEIALGALLPAISKGIAHLAEDLPANATNLKYKIALQAMKEEQTTKLLETGVKFGREYLKGEATVLEGEDDMDAFLAASRTSST